MITPDATAICWCGHVYADHNWGHDNPEYKNRTICNLCPEYDPCWEFTEMK